jgi:polyisoprenyl-phosphate glycosyltransferase
VPIFDEEDVLPAFAARLRDVLDTLVEDYEVVTVDDGSRDKSLPMLHELRSGWPQVRVVELRRNSGHQAAITAGLALCDGDWVVTIDADLQDPPELIPQLLRAAAEAGADVVYAVRADRRHDSWFKRTSARAYYKLMRRAAGDDVPTNAGDFRLMARDVVNTLNGLPERHRVYRLLVPWLGFRSATVHYERGPRAAGTSKYPLSKMGRLAFDSLTSFTAMPLRIATWAGVFGSLVCIAGIGVALIAQILGATVPGWASVFVAVFFLGAIQLLCLGLLGEYIGRLYAEAQHRPLYLVRSDTGGPQPPGGSADSHPASGPV